MKKLRLLFFAIPFILFSSCDKTEDPVDESSYYDQDGNCEDIIPQGTCCDVDGRILVKTGRFSNYTYKVYKSQTPKKINWTVVSGDIKLMKDQGTNEATFRFGKNFINGKISGIGNNGQSNECCDCQSTIEISKL
jgi:hypothetical protein